MKSLKEVVNLTILFKGRDFPPTFLTATGICESDVACCGYQLPVTKLF